MPADPTAPPRTLSAELHSLAERLPQEQVELRDVITLLAEQAYELLVLLLALPFCVPLLPGLSTPFGVVIALVAGDFALGRVPRLPERLLRTPLPPRFFRAVFEGTRRLVSFIERALLPRWLWLTATPGRRRLHYAAVSFAAILLLIPAPLPFSNTLPALGIVLCTTGLMQRDGLAILAGYVCTLAGALYFALAAVFGIEGFAWLRAWWAGV